MLLRCIDCNKYTDEVNGKVIARFPDLIVRCPLCEQKRGNLPKTPVTPVDQNMYRR